MSKACPLCNEKGYTVVYKKIKNYPEALIVKCTQCSHVYTYLEDYPANEKMYNDEVYQVIDNRNSIFDRLLTWEYKKIMRRIKLLKPSGHSLLDFGCGKGKFGYIGKNSGMIVKGIETSKTRAEYARNIYGLEVNEDFYTSGKLFDHDFDVLSLLHVLEHLPEPKLLLNELIKHNLSQEGIVLIEVPNLRSWQALIAGSRWLHLDVPHHINHFTAARLKKFAEASGLQIKRRVFFSFHLGVLGMVDSFLKLFGYRGHIIYDLKNKKKRLLIPAIIILLPFAFSFETIAALLGYGGIIRQYGIRSS